MSAVGQLQAPDSGALSDHDRAFLAAFETGEMEGIDFDHRAHVQLGWIHVRTFPLPEAIERFRNGLKQFTAQVGAAAKYHETMTWFYLLLIAERDARGTYPDFDAFLAANGDLVEKGAALLERYYDRGTLDDPVARRHFILPGGGA